MTSLPAGRRAAALSAFLPLLERSERRLLDLTAGGDHLPPPSLDYWEVRDDRLALGTAAPAALGLREAAALRALSGRPDEAATTPPARRRSSRRYATGSADGATRAISRGTAPTMMRAVVRPPARASSTRP